MTITDFRPVAWPTMTDEPNILDRTAVGNLIGVEADTVSIYLRWSKPGGPYESRPFPAPDRKFGRSPAWSASRTAEIIAWAVERPRHGVGGRPRS